MYIKFYGPPLPCPIKLRQAGFSGCQDTEESITYWLRSKQEARLLPI